MPEWSLVGPLGVGAAGLVVGAVLAHARLGRRYLRPVGSGRERGHRSPPWSGVTPARRVAGRITVVTAAAWALIAGALPVPDTIPDAAVLTVHVALAAVVVLMAEVDVAERRLPDPLTVPAAACSATAAGLALGLEEPPGDPVTALLAGVVVPLMLLVATLLAGGIGLGDVKLSVSLSVALGWHGWDAVVTGFCASWLLAGGTAVAMLLRGRAHRDTPIPLGPYLGAGALLALLW